MKKEAVRPSGIPGVAHHAEAVTKETVMSEAETVADETATVRVAYHAGPPEIGFYGREWIRDVAQWIPTTDWIAMNNRADIGEFDFKEEM